MPTVHLQYPDNKQPNNMDKRKLIVYGIINAFIYMAIYTTGTLIIGDEKLDIRSVLFQGVFFGFFMALIKRKGWF